MGLNKKQKKVKQWPKGNFGRKIEKTEGHYFPFALASLVFQWLPWQTAHKTSVMARWFPANWTLALWALSWEYTYHFSTAVLHGFIALWRLVEKAWASASSFDAFNSFFQPVKLTWVSILGTGNSYCFLSRRKQLWESQAPLSELAMGSQEPACTSPGLQSLLSPPLFITHFHLWLHHVVRSWDTFPAHHVTSSSPARSVFKGDHPPIAHTRV